MADVAMILKRSPYGCVNAAEAIRHAMGAVVNEMSVDMVLVDGGVLLAKKGQDGAGTGLTGLEGPLKDCLEMEIPVYVDEGSLEAQGLAEEDLVEGVKRTDGSKIARLLKDARTTIIF
jgi:tRNA 2-thiouridine synthesizing protein D